MPRLKHQQTIRLNNTLLAASGGIVMSAVLGYAHLAQNTLVSSYKLLLLLSIFWLVNALFVALIYLGWNLRFREPALTLPQMVWASGSAMVALMVSYGWDGAMYLLILLTMVFGVFRVTVSQFNQFCVFTIAGLFIAIGLRSLFFAPSLPLTAICIQWLTFGFCAIALTRLCSSIVTLRLRLHQKNDALEEALKARSYFLANMSHEIRTPMNGVLGMLELVLRTPLPEEPRRFLKIAQSSGHGLLTIINDILDFSKIEAGKLTIEPIVFDLWHLVSEVIVTFSARAQEKNIELILDIAPDVPKYVRADPVRMRQVLNNLLGNALKFTEQGEVVVALEAQHVGQTCRLCWQVRDTGIGIPANQQDELFKSFTQADASTTRMYGGTGLGLAICKQLCHLMGGEIDVVSQPSVGSNFRFWLPVEVESRQQNPSVQRDSLSGLNALIVDDNETNLLIFQKQLELKQVNTTLANTPEAALVILQRELKCPFDLAIIDMQMPQMDGEMLAEKIRELPQCINLPLIILTSIMEDMEREKLQQLRVAAYLNKPVQPQLLYKALQRAVGHQGDTLQLGNFIADDVAPRAASKRVLPNVKILLAEDNQTNQQVAVACLSEMGIKADVAENGEHALTMLTSAAEAGQPYQLVLMDCQMPKMDGYQTTQAIRQSVQADLVGVPIIAMTAHAMAGDRDKCLASGMSDYLSKPLEFDALQKKLFYWLDQGGHVLHPEPINTPPHVSPSVSLVEVDSESVQNQKLVASPHWDAESLLKLVRYKEPRIRSLLESFFTSVDSIERDIIDALRRADWDRAEKAIHGLKGASANLGAVALPKLLAAKEVELKVDPETDHSEWITMLSQELTTLKTEMKAYLASLPGAGVAKKVSGSS